MDFFWQITVVESTLNVAVFAVAVIAFGIIWQKAAEWRLQSPRLSDASVGILFGAATAVVLLLPVHMNGGASTGSQTVLLSLAGLIAGPFAAFMAFLVSGIAQALSAPSGSAVDGFGLVSLLTATCAGVAFRGILDVRYGTAKIAYFHFPLLGAACAIIGLGALWAFQGWQAMQESALAAVLASTLVATVLGTLLLHEIRRHETEQELRESEARLAAQASELAEARDNAERANRAKSAFLANMSHELRTPLNAILGFSEIISLESFGPIGVPRYKEYAGDIHSSGAHLLSLINDVLDVAKIESGKMEIAPGLLDAKKAFEVALKLLGDKAREKKQQLAIMVPANAPQLYADERALKQMLINIVSNAVKYTPEGGNITVTGGPSADGGFQILCEDNGDGIPADKLANIFSPFHQVDNHYGRQAGGTGLGLSLVKKLTEMHGGRVWMESEFGKGCRVYLVFPPAPAGKSEQAA